MNYIKQLSTVVALILSIIPLSIHAQSSSKRLTIGKLVDEFETAFVADSLEKLDAKRPNRGKMRVIITYDTIEPETKVFRTFGELGRWLRSRETDSAPTADGRTVKLPFRVTNPPTVCRRGLCLYDYEGGILHNHLYLKKILYGYRNGRPYIKTIFLYNG